MDKQIRKQMNEQFLKLNQLDRMEYTQRKDKILNWESGINKIFIPIGVFILYSLFISFMTVSSLNNPHYLASWAKMAKPMLNCLWIIMSLTLIIFFLEKWKISKMLRELRDEYFKLEVKLKDKK